MIASEQASPGSMTSLAGLLLSASKKSLGSCPVTPVAGHTPLCVKRQIGGHAGFLEEDAEVNAHALGNHFRVHLEHDGLDIRDIAFHCPGDRMLFRGSGKHELNHQAVTDGGEFCSSEGAFLICLQNDWRSKETTPAAHESTVENIEGFVGDHVAALVLEQLIDVELERLPEEEENVCLRHLIEMLCVGGSQHRSVRRQLKLVAVNA